MFGHVILNSSVKNEKDVEWLQFEKQKPYTIHGQTNYSKVRAEQDALAYSPKKLFMSVSFTLTRYLHITDLQVPLTSSSGPCHVLSCLYDNAFKRSLAIYRKSMALCPVNRLLSTPIYPACAEQGHL